MGRQYFGTDGIRGTVGQAPITPDFVLRLAHAVGNVLRKSEARPTVLWLALITTPREARCARVKYATPGVGNGPNKTTSTPAELKPLSSALSSI